MLRQQFFYFKKRLPTGSKSLTKDQQHIQKTMNLVHALTLLTCVGALMLLLSGCSTTSETFDTQPVQGVGAKSISEVNAMVDRGELRRLHTGTDQTKERIAPVFSAQAPATLTAETVQLSDHTLVYRQPEKHLRVWIAPYQDGGGNLHEGAIVHTLVRPSFWHMNPNPFQG